ncbi:MAG TPA: PA14 domain-containing protein, partial [Chloroflexota bacterium]|nr:PA14 domain-containing protein [Chloroflexota bacterium]
LPILKSTYPEASQELITGRDNSILFTGFKVDRAVATRDQGLLKRCGGTEQLEIDPSSLDQMRCASTESVEWTGSLFVDRSGHYRLTVEGRAAEIYIDGDGLSSAGRSLAQGWHTISLHAQPGSSSSHMALKWQRDGQPLQTVQGQYLQSRALPGTIRRKVVAADGRAEESLDRAIGFRNLGDATTVRPPATFVWNATLNVPATGRYLFELRSDGEAVLSVADRVVAAISGKGTSLRNEARALELPAGPKEFEIKYHWQNGVMGMVEALWTPPGGAQSIIPPSALSRP